MENVIADIRAAVQAYAAKMRTLSDADFSARPAPGKWSKKELIGHLADSAQNNLQRFVRGQYETDPKIVYAQDDWVTIQQYQSYDREAILQLWTTLNEHICHVLKYMPEAHYPRTCNTGKQAVELHDLKWLAEDYVAHLKHHLGQLDR